MKPTIRTLGKLIRGKTAYVLLLCALAVVAARAQTLTSLHSFSGTDGAGPYAAPVQGTDGNLYGTTGAVATVFKMTLSGTLTTLYTFCSKGNPNCPDGNDAYQGLVQATGGDFYGTTVNGGANSNSSCYSVGCGTIFKITPGGALTTLYSFCSQSSCTDGYFPYAGLVQATNGDFYGTTGYGGANGAGTLFKITSSGALTKLYDFCSQAGCADGGGPYEALVQAANGDLYGTTVYGGTSPYVPGGAGTIFKITLSGTLTTLYSFCSQAGCPDGMSPYASLVQATNGDLYGTTNTGANIDPNGLGAGTVFKITPTGELTTMYSFCSQMSAIECIDGENPQWRLIQASDGNLYGTTCCGGAGVVSPNGDTEGTIFRITPEGTLTTLYDFCAQTGCTDGTSPDGGVYQATNGEFYGTTCCGGLSGSGFGTVFRLSVGLGPFVKTRTTSGKVGAVVEILGTNLTGATSVTFNGIPSLFRVVASSLIVTTVPTGATTGTIRVVTPSGTLSNYPPFRVLQ